MIAAVIDDHKAKMTEIFNGLGQPGVNVIAEVVLPSGNGNLSRGHMQSPALVAAGNASLSMPWRMQPSDRTASYLEVYAPLDAQNLCLDVTPPGASTSRVLTIPDAQSLPRGQLLVPLPGQESGKAIATRQRGYPSGGLRISHGARRDRAICEGRKNPHPSGACADRASHPGRPAASGSSGGRIRDLDNRRHCSAERCRTVPGGLDPTR